MTFYAYRDTAGEWRWKLVASNGKNIANSGEGYTRKAGCLRAIRQARKGVPGATLLVEKTERVPVAELNEGDKL